MENTVTQDMVTEAIESEEYLTIGKKTTLCLITLKNGFEIVGTSACVDVAKYSLETGKPYAKSKAIDQVWSHLGVLLQHTLHHDAQITEATKCPDEIDEAAQVHNVGG